MKLHSITKKQTRHHNPATQEANSSYQTYQTAMMCIYIYMYIILPTPHPCHSSMFKKTMTLLLSFFSSLVLFLLQSITSPILSVSLLFYSSSFTLDHLHPCSPCPLTSFDLLTPFPPPPIGHPINHPTQHPNIIPSIHQC